MFTKYKLMRINKLIAALHIRMASLSRMRTNANYDFITKKMVECNKQLNSLLAKEQKLRYSASRLPGIMGDKFFRWVCVYALVVIGIACLAG